MRKNIDLATWNRKHLFYHYLDTDFPYIIVTAEADVTKLFCFTQENDISFHFSMVYAATKIANQITNFKYRFQDGVPFEIDHNYSFTTHLQPGAEIFNMVDCDDYDTITEFAKENQKKANLPVVNGNMAVLQGRLDFIEFSSLPWLSYSSFIRTIKKDGVDCNPKISFGKLKKENNRILLPVSCQTHHGLMDGYHVGLFYQHLQEYLDEGRF